jgi:hypothetical protein
MINFLGNGRIVIVIVAIYLLFAAVLFPVYAKKMNQAALTHQPESKKKDLKPLDLRFQYSKSEVEIFFTALGPKGQQYYRLIASKIDMAYPIAYSLFFMSLMAFFLKKKKWTKGFFPILLFLPLCAAIPDYLENFNILRMMDQGPTELLATKGSLFTQLKWVAVLLSLAITLILAGTLVFRPKK